MSTAYTLKSIPTPLSLYDVSSLHTDIYNYAHSAFRMSAAYALELMRRIWPPWLGNGHTFSPTAYATDCVWQVSSYENISQWQRIVKQYAYEGHDRQVHLQRSTNQYLPELVEVEQTYNTEVGRPIDPQLRIHDAPVLTQQHRRRAHGVIDRPAVLPHVLLEARTAAREDRRRRHLVRAHSEGHRLRAVQRERGLEHVHGHVEVCGIREVVWVDRGRHERVGGSKVNAAPGEGVREEAGHGAVAFSRFAERVWVVLMPVVVDKSRERGEAYDVR